MFFFFLCVALKQELTRKHKDALQTCKSHNLALLKTNQQAELEVSILSPSHLLPDTFIIGKSCVFSFQALEVRVREEQRMMDKKIVAEMDQKVIDQQNTLEKAGVPGFYITTNPQVISVQQRGDADEKASNCCLLLQELTMQMNLLELILKLQQKESQSGIM